LFLQTHKPVLLLPPVQAEQEEAVMGKVCLRHITTTTRKEYPRVMAKMVGSRMTTWEQQILHIEQILLVQE
jgi:hypothetical protein